MFGYNGETKNALARVVALRRAAMLEWPFLTTLDLSMIHNDVQLASIVKDRMALSRAEAEQSVFAWSARSETGSANGLASLERWSDDGGASRAGRSP